MNRLAYLRKSLGFTLRELGEKTGIVFQTLARLENGSTGLRESYINKLCAFYSVTVDFLLGKTDKGIYVETSDGFITINKADFENYIYEKRLSQHIFNGSVHRIPSKDLEEEINPLLAGDLLGEIKKELDAMPAKNLEKVYKFIKEILT